MKVVVIEVADAEELKSVLDAIASRQDVSLEFPKPEVPAEEPKPEEPKGTGAPSGGLVLSGPKGVGFPGGELPIEELAISSRLVKVLHEKHIDTISALTSLRERDLKRIPQIGQASLREIKNALNRKGYRLRRRDFKGAA